MARNDGWEEEKKIAARYFCEVRESREYADKKIQDYIRTEITTLEDHDQDLSTTVDHIVSLIDSLLVEVANGRNK